LDAPGSCRHMWYLYPLCAQLHDSHQSSLGAWHLHFLPGSLALHPGLHAASNSGEIGMVVNSGRMAFTKLTGPTAPATSRLLLLTDAGHDAVHVIDVTGQEHVGYVAAPGTIARPRGVAARGSLAAISTWSRDGAGDHVVRIFEGSGTRWSVVRVLAGGFGGPGSAGGQLKRPFGLRFTGDGTGLVVAEWLCEPVPCGGWDRHGARGCGAKRSLGCRGMGGWVAGGMHGLALYRACGSWSA
jgi:hypothetical protein